ncbi:MAG: hypothetical protein ACRYGK_06480 [Janthinobacterium lividum]
MTTILTGNDRHDSEWTDQISPHSTHDVEIAISNPVSQETSDRSCLAGVTSAVDVATGQRKRIRIGLNGLLMREV